MGRKKLGRPRMGAGLSRPGGGLAAVPSVGRSLEPFGGGRKGGPNWCVAVPGAGSAARASSSVLVKRRETREPIGVGRAATGKGASHSFSTFATLLSV